MVKLRLIIGILIIIGVVTGTIIGVHAQEDGLVAEWHFDEGEGNVLKDSSGNGNDGTIYGATWVEGKYGQALSFDGVDDYVEISDSPELSGGGKSLTVEAWIKPETVSQHIIIGKYRDTSWKEWGINIYSNKLHFQYEYGGNNFDSFYGSNIDSNVWQHVAFVYSYTDKTTILYLNGINDGMRTLPTDLPDTDTPVQIGRVGGSYGSISLFKGLIDEIKIYNSALTAEEMKQHYESGPTALSLTKTASSQSIKQGQTATITLTVKNTGSTEIRDIEIADTIPSYLTFVDGETSKIYDSLAPQDSRQISYTLQFNDAGTFNFEPAIATYADDKRNYNTVESKPASIEVIRSIIENSAPTPKPTNGNVNSASVNLHGEKTDVSIKKSASPNSIRQFQESIITISLENSGTTDVTDIEITDAIRPSFDLISGDFPNPKRYDLIRPGETRDLQYTISAKESGTFTLDPATVTYANEDGNIQEAKSEPASIKVIPSTDGSTSGTSHNPSLSTASVQLHGEKTDVVLGEDILFKLSAVNLITKPTMHVQVIIIPPSGMSVTSSAFAKSGAGQYTTTYELEPGSGKDIEVAIRSNQVGDFNVNGRIIYYFGDDREDAEDHTLILPITVRADAESMERSSESDEPSTPGFSTMVAAIALLLAYVRRKV